MTRLLRILGTVLIVGALAHSAGAARLYLTAGVPDANRVLLDIWIAEAQLLSGALYLAAWRARMATTPWRALAAFGALTMIGFAAPMVPVVLGRAPLYLSIPSIVYLVASLLILAAAIADSRAPHPPADRGASA